MRLMRYRGLSFESALNQALRKGIELFDSQPVIDFPTYAMGDASVDLTRSIRLAAELEDDQVLTEVDDPPG